MDRNSIGGLIRASSQMLESSGVPDARRQAGSLLAHVLDCDRTFIISHRDDLISDNLIENFRALVARRAGGEPLQYITGRQEFFNLTFEITPDVLIPRPETELLIEAALSLLRRDHAPLICDVGTGSGCIVISLLHELPGATAIAIDVSPAALQIARRNAQRHSVADRIEFVVSDCFDGLEQKREFDLIVSNPPYVREDVFAGLQREVRDHEPRIALTPGGDGLGIIRRLIRDSSKHLKIAGYLLMEIGYDQRDAVMDLIDPNIWKVIDVHKDLQGIPRTVVLQKADRDRNAANTQS